MGITDVDSIYEYKLYDNRDNYPFLTVRMPDLCSKLFLRMMNQEAN